MKRIIFFIIIILFSGCIKSRDYFSAKRGAVRMNIVFPFGEGKYSKNYIVVDNVVIDKTDTKRIVKKKLGKPSFIGTTMEGYQFYRYEDKNIEIYFDKNRVVGWNRLDFRP